MSVTVYVNVSIPRHVSRKHAGGASPEWSSRRSRPNEATEPSDEPTEGGSPPRGDGRRGRGKRPTLKVAGDPLQPA